MQKKGKSYTLLVEIGARTNNVELRMGDLQDTKIKPTMPRPIPEGNQ